mmetsp:Transcript_30452/g.50265  ORF Transcript_30452/g.50265 Transcript_30452/m.50265 type:complete len:516 (+) Transcript_30452:176-1723(+)
MKTSSLILIAAFGAAVHAERTDNKDHHKQTYGKESGGGLRKLLNGKHIPTQSRIVGGSDTAAGEYPFFVDWDQCGASLIHKDIILSAAHCYGVGTNTVYIGSSSRNFGSSGRGVQRTVKDRVPHPSYNDETVDYDYLVMKLDRPVDITPVALNEDANSPSDQQELTVIGYGSTYAGGAGTNTLQGATVNYIPTDTCNANYSGEINSATMMCGGVGGGIDSCQGDSGGPIFVETDDYFKQVGIVSWGIGCAQPNFPGVYSRVSGEIDWIKKQICELSDFPPEYCDDDLGDSGGGGGGGEVAVRFDVTYDEYPNENGWSVRKGQTTVINKGVGTLSAAGFVMEKFMMDPGFYTFEINDSFADGMCCSFGQGGYEIYAETSSGDVLLASGNGRFGASETQQFSVPDTSGSNNPLPTGAPVPAPTPAPVPDATSAPVPAPTSSPVPGITLAPTPSPVPAPVPDVCKDTNQVFMVDDSVGSRDCTWLGDNQARYKYLCRFVDVAAACKVTCNACQYFQPS